MVRVKTIVNEYGEVSVVEESATVFSNDDIVMSSVDYDILMNRVENLEEYEEYLHNRLDKIEQFYESLPYWLQKLLDRFDK